MFQKPCTILLLSTQKSQWDQRDLVNLIPRHKLPSKLIVTNYGRVWVTHLYEDQISIVHMFACTTQKRTLFQPCTIDWSFLTECLIDFETNHATAFPIYMPKTNCLRNGIHVNRMRHLFNMINMTVLFI